MKFYDNATDIEIDEALAILDRCQYRVSETDYTFGGEVCKDAHEEIRYDNGPWRSLCRTDLLDDVCTEECTTLAKIEKRQRLDAWKAAVRKSFGVRVGTSRFAVIDRHTDG